MLGGEGGNWAGIGNEKCVIPNHERADLVIAQG